MNIWKIIEIRKDEFDRRVTNLLEDRKSILSHMKLWPAKAYAAVTLIATIVALAMLLTGFKLIGVAILLAPGLMFLADICSFFHHERRLHKMQGDGSSSAWSPD